MKSMPVYLGRIANLRKLPFENYKSQSLNICIYGGHMYICIPNMKFLCLTLCQGEVCTDVNTNADAGRRRTEHDCIRLFG